MILSMRAVTPKLVAVVAALGLLAAGCSGGQGSAGGNDTGPVTIYGAIGLSGDLAPVAGPLRDGMQAAVDLVNENGGLMGRKVNLELENSQSDATKALSLVTKRIDTDKPQVIFTGSGSNDSLATLPVITQNKIFGLTAGAAEQFGDPKIFPYNFTASPSSGAIARLMADELVDKRYQKVAILYLDDAASNTFVSAYAKAFPSAGIQVVGTEKYPPGTIDMSSQLARLSAKGPDAIVISGLGMTTYVLKSRTRAGLQGIPFVGDGTNATGDLSQGLSDQEKAGYEGLAFAVAAQGKGGPGKPELVNRLKAAGARIDTPLGVQAFGYDLVLNYANAVVQEQTFDPDRLKAALEKGIANKKYPLAATADYGWTPEQHMSDGKGMLAFLPITPLVNGEYQPG